VSAPVWRPVEPNAIPEPLKAGKRFVGWRYEDRKGDPKPAKMPYSPIMKNPREGASSTNPSHWTTFDKALKYAQVAGLDGTMRAFDHADNMVGIDLDNCLNPSIAEPSIDDLEPWAAEIVKRLDTYTEVSPSRTGVKMWAYGTMPPFGHKRGDVEMYGSMAGMSGPCGRFFTQTGHHLKGTPTTVSYRPDAILAIHHEVFGKEPDLTVAVADPDRPIPALDLGDEDVLRLASESPHHGTKFRRLWSGDTSDYAVAGNDGQSEAEAGFCEIVAFFGGPDRERIKRLLLSSGLRREKHDRADYLDRTIDFVLKDKTRFYGDSIQPPPSAGSDGESTCDCERCPSRDRARFLERSLLDRDDLLEFQRTVIQTERAAKEATAETIRAIFDVLAIPDTQMNARTKLVFMFTGCEAASRNSRGVANLSNIAIAEGTGLTENVVSDIMQDLATRAGSPIERHITREWATDENGLKYPRSIAQVAICTPERTYVSVLRAAPAMSGPSDKIQQKKAEARARAASSLADRIEDRAANWGHCSSHNNDLVDVKGFCPECGEVVGERFVRVKEFDLLNPEMRDSGARPKPVVVPVTKRPEMRDSGQPLPIDPEFDGRAAAMVAIPLGRDRPDKWKQLESPDQEPHVLRSGGEQCDGESPDWLVEWPDDLLPEPPPLGVCVHGDGPLLPGDKAFCAHHRALIDALPWPPSISGGGAKP